MPIGVALLRRTRAGEPAGHHRSLRRDAVAPVAVDPVEAVLDVGAGLLGQQVAWEPGRGTVAEGLALCGRKMRLETVENRVGAGAGLQRLQHHDAQRHRTSVAPRRTRARERALACVAPVNGRVAVRVAVAEDRDGLLGQQVSSPLPREVSARSPPCAAVRGSAAAIWSRRRSGCCTLRAWCCRARARPAVGRSPPAAVQSSRRAAAPPAAATASATHTAVPRARAERGRPILGARLGTLR